VTAAAARPPDVPEWMELEASAAGGVYSWPLLPRRPALIGFFLLLAALLTLPGPLLLAAALLGGAADVWPYAVALSLLTLATARFFVVSLLGRARLALSLRALDFEVLLFGRSLRSERRHLRREELLQIRITDPVHQGPEVTATSGRPFRIKVPVGAGALSRRELEALRDRWLRDLGRA
jgi:hypothetical protein